MAGGCNARVRARARVEAGVADDRNDTPWEFGEAAARSCRSCPICLERKYDSG